MRNSRARPEAVSFSAVSIACASAGGMRSRRPMTRKRTPAAAHAAASVRKYCSSRASNDTTSLMGRSQLSEENAYSVMVPMPRPGAARTTRRTDSTPARCPSERTRPREEAQRPLPSRRMATWSWDCGINVKVLLFIEYPGKIFCCLTFARDADQSFHVVQILFQRAATGARQAIFGFRHAPVESFRTAQIAGVFQLARMDAQVAVRGAQQLFQLVESERFVHGERADDSKARTLVDQTVQIRRRIFRGPPVPTPVPYSSSHWPGMGPISRERRCRTVSSAPTKSGGAKLYTKRRPGPLNRDDPAWRAFE